MHTQARLSVVHCRSLGYLSSLSLERVIVGLPELEVAAPKLVHLSLQASVLAAGSVAYGGCDTFAKGIWGNLQTLNLSGACISALLYWVALPSLLDLSMNNFWQQDKCHVDTYVLGHGCPRSTSLSFHLLDMADFDAAQNEWFCGCTDFAALRSVSVVCAPDALAPHSKWPVRPPALDLPPLVTRLVYS
jgi:hypothetical protein